MLEYRFVWRSKTIELNEYEDPQMAFSKLINIIKSFAGIFNFKVERIAPFWGDETEGQWHYRQTGYTFELTKRCPGSQMYLVSASIICICYQHSLKVEDEKLYPVNQNEDDED